MQHLLPVVGVISFAIGLVALLLSLFQSRQLNKQYKHLENHSTSLLAISDSLSTRYIGPFPEYLHAVTRIIDEAKSELRVVTGNPTPAYFSAPDLWLAYSQALERQVHAGVLRSVVCADERHRRARLALQFPHSEEQWKVWNVENRSKVERLLKFGYGNLGVESLNHSTFLEILTSVQNRMISDALRTKGITVIEVDQLIPVQVWIADKTQAVFSIQTLPSNSASHGFVTSDQRIVSALQQMTELFAIDREVGMTEQSRIDFIATTEDLNRSISFYRDVIGLEMRLLSNPVAIFKYDFAALYVYQMDFFRDQFAISPSDLTGGGMLSIEISSREHHRELRGRLEVAKQDCTVLRITDTTVVVKDFNGLVLELWVNRQAAAGALPLGSK